MSLIGPERLFAAAQRTSAIKGKPDGRRSRAEPLLLTDTVEKSPLIVGELTPDLLGLCRKLASQVGRTSKRHKLRMLPDN
jgi:hypothetical protein